MKMLKKYSTHLTILLIFILTSCATQKVSTIVGYDYDEQKNQTDYFVFPYGNVLIPGKWEKSNYNSTSRQQFFRNKDSVIIAIAFAPCNKFEFNVDNSKTGFEFVKSYYEWDSQYFVKNNELSRELIEQDSINNYIIWRLNGFINGEEIDNYFLFGEKNCFVSNYSVLETDKWTVKEKIEFLKNLYYTKVKE